MGEEKKENVVIEKVVPIFLKKETIDPVKHVSSFETGLIYKGRGLIVPISDNDDKVILNPYHNGGEIKIRMKIISAPAKRFFPGDHIANLILLDE